ncbi:MAG: hypothetical protein OXG98_17635 [Gemmatimonadetes bacterium]|nr:hypothetical protein [Gemmatimonadota bacterium]
MTAKPLELVVQERPFPEYAAWWPVGSEFTTFMSDAVVTEWRKLYQNDGAFEDVQEYLATYLEAVYHRPARGGLLESFVGRNGGRAPQAGQPGQSTQSGQPTQSVQSMRSGEFDALSYAFYRSAFERIERHIDLYDHALERERRLFTVRVGKRFFDRLRDHLELDLPGDLAVPDQVRQLSEGIGRVGRFLHDQGYLRSHFAFRFDVDIEHGGTRILQHADDVIERLRNGQAAYALYEMGYPVILPSAVYLYHTIGEAQHHSSRTIENLFGEVGYDARETDDFDPIGYPADMVVELWEIRKG